MCDSTEISKKRESATVRNIPSKSYVEGLIPSVMVFRVEVFEK